MFDSLSESEGDRNIHFVRIGQVGLRADTSSRSRELGMAEAVKGGRVIDKKEASARASSWTSEVSAEVHVKVL